MARGPLKRTQQNEIAENDDVLVMSIRLKSGRFESSIEVPLYATDGERTEFVDQWLNLMEAGIRCGSKHRAQKETATIRNAEQGGE